MCATELNKAAALSPSNDNALMQSYTLIGMAEDKLNHAARAEDQLHASALVDWAVAEDPGVGAKDFWILRKVLAEVRGACFFLAFENEA